MIHGRRLLAPQTALLICGVVEVGIGVLGPASGWAFALVEAAPPPSRWPARRGSV